MTRPLRSLASAAVPVVGALALAVGSTSVTRPPQPRLIAVAEHVPRTLDAAGIGIGPTSGAPTVRVVGDYECSACEALEHTIGDRLLELARKGRIRYQLVQAPLPAHRRAPKAAAALICAERHGDAWGMHRLLVHGRSEWGWGDDPRAAFVRYAGKLGLAGGEFEDCLGSTYARRRLDRDRAVASAIGATRLPTIFVDSTLVMPGQSFAEVLSVVEDRLGHDPAAAGTEGKSP